MAWKIRFVVTQQQGSALWECQDAAPRLLLLQLTFSNLGSRYLLLLHALENTPRLWAAACKRRNAIRGCGAHSKREEPWGRRSPPASWRGASWILLKQQPRGNILPWSKASEKYPHREGRGESGALRAWCLQRKQQNSLAAFPVREGSPRQYGDVHGTPWSLWSANFMAVLDKWKAHQRCKSLAILISLTSFSRIATSFLPFLLYTCVNAPGVFHFISLFNGNHRQQTPVWLHWVQEHHADLLKFLATSYFKGFNLVHRKFLQKIFFPQIEIVLATTSAQQLYQSFGPLIKRTRIISFKDLTCILKYLKVNLKKKIKNRQERATWYTDFGITWSIVIFLVWFLGR